MTTRGSIVLVVSFIAFVAVALPLDRSSTPAQQTVLSFLAWAFLGIALATPTLGAARTPTPGATAVRHTTPASVTARPTSAAPSAAATPASTPAATAATHVPGPVTPVPTLVKPPPVR